MSNILYMKFSLNQNTMIYGNSSRHNIDLITYFFSYISNCISFWVETRRHDNGWEVPQGITKKGENP